MEDHLAKCTVCTGDLESLRATIDLLHRVPMVSPPRSFAIAEVEPKRRATPFAVLGAANTGAALLLERRLASLAVLSTATASAALLLAFFFVSDSLDLFGSKVPVAERFAEATPVPEQVSDGAEAGYEVVENWPFWQLEVVFSVLVIMLGALTVIWWLRRRKRGERALEG